MKSKSYIYIVFVLALFGLFSFQITDDVFDKILKKVESYNELHPQEKVYLHLDKPYYAIGDDIWFKAYVVNTHTSKPSGLSGILYVDFLDQKDSLRKQLKLPLIGGISWGDIKLTDSIIEGNYRIRAYTQYMRNFDADYYYDKTIKTGHSWANELFAKANFEYLKEKNKTEVISKITFSNKNGTPYSDAEVSYTVNINTKIVSRGKSRTNTDGVLNLSFSPKSTEVVSGMILATLKLPNGNQLTRQIAIKGVSENVDLQFFPEGGNMVVSIPTKIGLKCINANGLGADVSGTIFDSDGAKVTDFKSSHLGMGYFYLTPLAGKTYVAKAKFGDGSERAIDLPTALPSGSALTINSSKENLTVKVLSSGDLLGSGKLKLLAQNNGNVYSVSDIPLAKQITILNIPKRDLPSGITHFTLFSTANQPICERLVFIKNQSDLISLTLRSNKPIYEKREKVELSLEALFQGKPIEGSYSASVTNSGIVTPDEQNESNILTSILLTSDLKGYVEKPNYYFLSDDETRAGDLDNLLLTQGWRRTVWKQILNDVPLAQYYPIEKGLKITGKVETIGGKPAISSRVSLTTTQGGFFTTDTLTDQFGRFNFDNFTFNDSLKFVIQARSSKNSKNVIVSIDSIPTQVFSRNKNRGDIEINVNESIFSYFKASENLFNELERKGLIERSIGLREVNIVKSKRKDNEGERISRMVLPDAVVSENSLKFCTKLSQCLPNMLLGVVVKGGQLYLGRSSQSMPMLILLDGSEVDAGMIDMINPRDVKKIDYLKSAANLSVVGPRGQYGILIITTKRGDGATQSKFSFGVAAQVTTGYSSSREFYSPKYETANTTPDYRSTIYWDPLVTTSSAGKGLITYYCSDQPGVHRAVIEGIDINGKLARAVYTYTVK